MQVVLRNNEATKEDGPEQSAALAFDKDAVAVIPTPLALILGNAPGLFGPEFSPAQLMEALGAWEIDAEPAGLAKANLPDGSSGEVCALLIAMVLGRDLNLIERVNVMVSIR